LLSVSDSDSSSDGSPLRRLLLVVAVADVSSILT
jgi:hypothetical protein